MSRDRLFIDTAYVQALLNPRDNYHALAQSLFSRVQAAETWITESVLTEIGNALSAINRQAASIYIHACYQAQNIHVVHVDTSLFKRALSLYEQRQDKTWGLTDCISFVIMNDHNLTEALTSDKHFAQAGFRVLMPRD
ncbi:MAG TPA: hypothetical protein VGD58_27270 [Herpetosiphonaceae bacterium]